MAEPSIINLQDYISKVIPIKQHFEDLRKKRDEIINMDVSIIRTIYSSPLANILNSNYQLYITDNIPYPILFKSNGEIKPIRNYEIRHLKNSIIRSLLILENSHLDLRTKMNCMCYVLYYFHFIKCHNPEDISASVIDSIQSIIRLILEKNLTLYRNINTRELLYSLDWKLKEEKMNKAAYSGINLRR